MKQLLTSLLLLLTAICQAQPLMQSNPSVKEKSLFLHKESIHIAKDTCYTGLYLKNVYDLHPEDYAYTVDFWLWFDHHQQALDPLQNVEIINAKQVNFIDQYHARADGNTLIASETGRVTLIHDWKLKNYPFDRQFLHIELEAGLDTGKMVLKQIQKGFKLYKGLKLPGWNIQSFRATESLITYDSDFGERQLKGSSTYSRITYTLEIQRHSWGLFFKLFAGLYISFFVAFLVFFVPPSQDHRFTLSIGALFAAVANKYVMDGNIPISTTFAFVDQVHFLTFLFILATLILSITSFKIYKLKHHERRRRFDRIAAWVVALTYVLSNLALIIGVYIGNG